MFKINALLLTAFMLFSVPALACDCSFSTITRNFENARFVAKVRLLDIRPDATNEEYHDADIQILDVYKGPRLSTIKIHSNLNSSCAFLPKVNSTWIVFADEFQGKLSFHYCSGSVDLTRRITDPEYPNADRNFKKEMKMKAQVLNFFYKQRIVKLNAEGLNVSPQGLELIKGYRNNNRFAVFQVDVNNNLSITKVSSLKKFQNRNLQKAVLRSLEQAAVGVDVADRLNQNTPTPVILVLYFYDDGKSDKSFVSMSSL
ncbi:hypothetical protein GCM10011387_31360 [Pedobacter quisquiliarum]|uniref:Tissue inhibitor of metalloproteinase n=1 Tax=Pedobacter quisquiliarum TaxID=1834438 RepID=A0A916XJP3_9SPHI|nr:hypothetical protein [Pedobacter quisquiliarum]GGC75384.1 hypothetical protein GCM10011387_31360 [Pedobacter quisquiliarum]